MTPRELWTPRLLCVDDEQGIRNALRRLFMDEPWEVDFAPDGEAALELVGENEYDVIVSDLGMPGMDGIRFLRKAREAQPDSLRILLSGYADFGIVVTALNNGEIYRFIAKPWKDEELTHNIRTALEHYQDHRERRRLAEELGHAAALEERLLEQTRSCLIFARSILDHVPLPIVAVDREGGVVYANTEARCRLEGPGRRLVGARADEVLDADAAGYLERAPGEEHGPDVPIVFVGRKGNETAMEPLEALACGDSAGWCLLREENGDG